MAVVEQSATSPLDMSAVPPALRARAARADGAIKNIREGRAPDQPAEPPAQAEGGDRQPPAQEPPRQQERPPQANSEPPRQELPRQDAQPEGWEQKFRSLQGKYDSETADLRTQLREQRRENDTLRESLSALEDRVRATEDGRPPAGSQEQPFDINAVLTEEERQDWGELAPVLAKVVGPLRDKIARLEGRQKSTEERGSKTAQDRTNDYLDREVPDWEKINKEPEFFNEWCLTKDEASGQTLGKLLQDAYNRNEGSRVAYFFKRYLSDKGRTSPDERQGQGGGGASAPKTLEQFAAPGKGRTATEQSHAGGAAEERRIPLSEYTGFLSDKTHNRLRMTTAEMKQKEAEYETAYREGRIDPNK